MNRRLTLDQTVMPLPFRPVEVVENLSQQPNGMVGRNPLVEGGGEQYELLATHPGEIKSWSD